RVVEHRSLDIGPVELLKEAALARYILWAHQGLEGDVARTGPGFRPGEDVGEREADPGDHHRPALDAAQPVDALLEPRGRHEILERIGARAADQSVDDHRPWLGGQRSSMRLRIPLVDAEL